MVAATVINANLSAVQSPETDINRAIALWEQANELLVDAGRMFADIKDGTKRKFNKLVEESGLETIQVSKLIKAAECADEIPTFVVGRLGLPMLLQLGQKRNQTAREAITHSDTQQLVAQKMKEFRVPTEPKEEKPVRFIGNQKGGVGKLRIEVPGCPEAVELEHDWKVSGLSPLEWLSQRVGKEAGGVETSQYKAATPETQTEQTVAQAELERYIFEQAIEYGPVVKLEGDAVSKVVEVTLEQSYEPAIATERYQLGWKEGEFEIANNTCESFAMWCEGQPVEITSVEGNVVQIQILRVTRDDGQSDMGFGNWIEEVPKAEKETQIQEVIQTIEVKKTETPDDEKLSKMLLKAKNWEKVSGLVDRDAKVLGRVIADWSLEQKEELLNQAIAKRCCFAQIAYIEANPTAIRDHEIDWIPLVELKQIFHKLSFRVHDITSGLVSSWHEECEFVNVTNLGSDDLEIWQFTSEGKEIKAWSREGLEVVAS